MNSGPSLIAGIDQAGGARPWLWWLGHCGFVLKFQDIIFYIDPVLSRSGAPLSPGDVAHADMILCSHAHPGHLDPATLSPMLAASVRAKVVIPKAAVAASQHAGVGLARMTTTDSGLRVEYFKNGAYARVYAVPSAHPELDWTPQTGYPYLGYLIRFGDCTVYHAGDCVPYPQLTTHLKPYNVTVALVPIGGSKARNFTPEQAAELAAAVGARWLVPMHYKNEGQVQPFVDHLLYHRPDQRFKVFQPGEGWQIPPLEPAA